MHDLLHVASVDLVLITCQDVHPDHTILANVGLEKLDQQIPRHRPRVGDDGLWQLRAHPIANMPLHVAGIRWALLQLGLMCFPFNVTVCCSQVG